MCYSVSNNSSSDSIWCDHSCRAYHLHLDYYCHRSLLNSQSKLDQEFHGAGEGQLPADIANNYVLQQVHVVARHGDSSPLTLYRLGQPPVEYECALMKMNESWNWMGLKDFPDFKPLQYGSEKVHSTTSMSLFPGVSSKPCGNGKLTRKGYYQLQALGSMMNKKYTVALLHNFSDTQQAVQDIYVQSTNFSVSWRSAGAFMLGFLPNHEIRKNTVIYISPGSLLQAPPPWINVIYHNCDNIKAFEISNLWKTNYHQTELAHFTPYLEQLVKMFQVTTSRHVAKEIFDSVITRGCHEKEKPLPCNIGGVCLNFTLALKLFHYVDWTFIHYFSLNSATVATLPFLRHSIYGTMKDMVDGEDKAKKFILSVSQDTTMMQLLVALGVHLDKRLAYASRLVFELWKEKTASQSYHMRVLLDGVPVTHQLTAYKAIQEDALHPDLLPFLDWEGFVLRGQYRDMKSYNNVCKKNSN